MQRFKDAEGREWCVSINGRTLKQVRDNIGILLTELVDDDCALLTSLFQDPILLADILWVIVEEQATAQGVTVKDFAEAFSGDCVATSRMALIEATIDFFEDPETRRMIREFLRKTMIVADKIRAVSTQTIEDLDIALVAESITDSYSDSLASAE